MAKAAVDYPSYDRADDLIRDLRAQAFIIEEITDGWRIRSPYNDNTTIAHRNGVHSAKIPDLKAMGFLPPAAAKSKQVCSECGMPFTGPMSLTVHRMEEHGFTLECKTCGQKGFTSVGEHRKHLAKHRREEKREAKKQEAKAPVEVPARQRVPKPEPDKPKRKRAPVRKGYTGDMAEFMEAIDDAKAAFDRVAELYKEMHVKYQQEKKRLASIEEAATRMVSKF